MTDEITRQEIAQKLTDYLHHLLTIEEVVEWAENGMMDGDFAEEDYELIRTTIGQIGLADVKAFGLTWEDCQQILAALGYQVQVTIQPSPKPQHKEIA